MFFAPCLVKIRRRIHARFLFSVKMWVGFVVHHVDFCPKLIESHFLLNQYCLIHGLVKQQSCAIKSRMFRRTCPEKIVFRLVLRQHSWGFRAPVSLRLHAITSVETNLVAKLQVTIPVQAGLRVFIFMRPSKFFANAFAVSWPWGIQCKDGLKSSTNNVMQERTCLQVRFVFSPCAVCEASLQPRRGLRATVGTDQAGSTM